MAINLANMIEEKNLKKTFIIATLVSTIVGTFTASMALVDKVQERRAKAHQAQIDKKQDGQITEIKDLVEELRTEKAANQAAKSNNSRSSSDGSRDFEKDEYVRAACRSRRLIEDMYEANLMNMGQQCARGDVITENKLQAQIIKLQQTVINVLQDALLNDRQLSKSDIGRLITAQEAAREGSLDALEGQYTRMISQRRYSASPERLYIENPSQRLLIEDSPKNRSARQLTFPVRTSNRSYSPPPRTRSLPALDHDPESLFCSYGARLQAQAGPLSNAFSPTGSQRCPACTTHLAIDTRDVWVFTHEAPGVRPRDFKMGARFVVKSHTSDGRFACVLCWQFRELDCICSSVDALVRHLGHMHSAAEFAQDDDLAELPADHPFHPA